MINDRIYNDAEDYLTACLEDRGMSYSPKAVKAFSIDLDRALARHGHVVQALTPTVASALWMMWVSGVMFAIDNHDNLKVSEQGKIDHVL